MNVFLNICFKRTEAHRATTCTHFCYCTIFPLLEHHALWVRLSKKFSSITNYFYQFNPLCVFFLLFWFVNLSFFNHHASNPLFCYILITLIYTNLFFHSVLVHQNNRHHFGFNICIFPPILLCLLHCFFCHVKSIIIILFFFISHFFVLFCSRPDQ